MKSFKEKEDKRREKRREREREREVVERYKIFKEKRRRREEGQSRTPNPSNRNPTRLHSS
jgi:hypothetical protein